jgi:hypothetical protein
VSTPPSIEPAETANSFLVGALVVNDRTDTWTSVPPELSGETRLLTARDDGTASPVASMYTIDVSGPCTLYLPLDPRYGISKLSWMDAAWTDSALTCSSSARSGWRIWKTSVAGPGAVVLGVDTQQYDGIAAVFLPFGGSSWTEIVVLPANQTSYGDIGLDASSTYTYRVRALLDGRYSAWSNEATATTSGGGPGADGGLATDGAGNGDGGRHHDDVWVRGVCGCGPDASTLPGYGMSFLLVVILQFLRRRGL